MTTTVAELDFDAIKTDLITFIKSNPTFSDYNFEGSALNAIIDILAYNTHNNAYYANMLHNEGFIDTAQKRASVVSRAKELGYVPKSATCSTAFVNIDVVGPTTSLVINKGTSFSSSNDAGTFKFIAGANYTSSYINSVQKFSDVKLVNGIMVDNSFRVDTLTNVRSIFSIPNKNIDISTLQVFVRDSISAIGRTEYLVSKDVFSNTGLSEVFFIQESYDGFYQIYFGSDILGKQPINGNVVEVNYIVTDTLSDADYCRTFVLDGTFTGATSHSITTSQVAFGGSDKEVIESIKFSAKRANAAKHRAVTTNDYISILREKFAFIKSVSVWGGEDNVPPVYGKVFISMQPVSGYTISDSIKTDVILPEIRSVSLLTVSPTFVDPTYTSIDFLTKVKFNERRTVSTTAFIDYNVRATVRDYVGAISQFNGDYLEAGLINKISNIDIGISSVDIIKSVGFKMTPLIGLETRFLKNINNAIVPGTIQSSKFQVYINTLKTVTIKEVPDSIVQKMNVSGGYDMVSSLGIYDSIGLVKAIGTVNYSSGKFDFIIGVYSYLSDSRFINLRCTLVDSDILVSKNQILIIDTDYADEVAGIVEHNAVNISPYGK
jgi:hypothetical protein